MLETNVVIAATALRFRPAASATRQLASAAPEYHPDVCRAEVDRLHLRSCLLPGPHKWGKTLDAIQCAPRRSRYGVGFPIAHRVLRLLHPAALRKDPR